MLEGGAGALCAEEAARHAQRCRAVADRLDREAAELVGILTTVATSHTEAVWDSTAAADSRRRLGSHRDGLEEAAVALRGLSGLLEAAAVGAEAAARAAASGS